MKGGAITEQGTREYPEDALWDILEGRFLGRQSPAGVALEQRAKKQIVAAFAQSCHELSGGTELAFL